MVMGQYQPPSLIGASNSTIANSFLPPIPFARAVGPIIQYEYRSLKPKKQVKELLKVLWPERKKLLFMKYGYKFNIRDRCVVCGTHRVWDASDPQRPGLPLHKVKKGYPLKGTYCDKHAALYMQYEMLEQKMIAEEHGLDFKQYIPKPRIPKILNPLSIEPLTSLKQSDIQSLSGVGWIVKPPKMEEETSEDEMFRLTVESNAINTRIQELLKTGTKVTKESE